MSSTEQLTSSVFVRRLDHLAEPLATAIGTSSDTRLARLLLSSYLHHYMSQVPEFISSHEVKDIKEEHRKLVVENAILRNQLARRLSEIEQRISRVEQNLPETRVVVLKAISREEAKEEVKQLFSTGRTLYYSDIASELGLDLEMVVGICAELRREGEIEVDANAVQRG